MKAQSIDMTRFQVFGEPRISTGLVGMVAIVILTHAAALLMNQPAAYWLDSHYATEAPFSLFLQAGPIVYLILFILYVAAVILLLRRSNISIGLPLVAALVFIHSLGLSKTTICGFHPLYQSHSATSCYSYSHVLFILVAIIFGLILLGPRLPKRFIYWGKRILLPLAVLWILLMIYGIFRAAFPPGSPWRPLTPVHSPGPRTMSAIAYDSKRQRAVLFGGVTVWNGDAWVYDNSTWEWDGKDWAEIETPVAPAGRILHAMAYDERRGKVILYGGQNTSGDLSDLWEWDGVTWNRLCPVCNPAARSKHKMIFDSERQEIMIYGGQHETSGFAEGWTWNGEAWNYFQFEESAPALYNSPLIYDGAHKRAVSFMGGDWGGTWLWEGNRWRKLDLAVQPPVRDDSVLVYDSLQNRSVLFGGTKDHILFDDTWAFDGETWARVDTPRSPSQRSRAVAFYDPVRRSIILYGGEFNSVYGDMWELILPEGDQ